MFGKKKKDEASLQQQRQPRYNGSSKVFSYYANRSSEHDHEGRLRPHEDRIKDEKSSFWLSQLPIILSLAVIILCIGYNLVLTTKPRVMAEQAGAGTSEFSQQQTASYEHIFETAFADSFQNRTKLTLAADRITQKIQTNHPELQSVRIDIPLIGQRPIVYVTPANQFAVMRSSNGIEYALSDTGRVMSTVSRTTSSNKNKLLLIDNSGLQFEPGDQAFSRANMDAITEVITQLKARRITVTTITLPANSQSFQVGLSGQTYFVKFSFQEDARQQAGAFIAAYQRFQQENISPKEYADVRVADRVYFK